ncbi:MAG: galactosyldiacylglycerol synthase [Selenomonadaceae bacterium]|nr:galactosyldiacylglycerol synthase [Selenomonadaceae bacterium]
MKVLILSASIGSGHTKAAQALQKILGDDAQIVDFMSREISALNWLTKKFYLTALKLIPDLYDRMYKFADGQKAGVTTRFIVSILMYLPLARLLKKIRPDVVICTHPFPEAAASLWKFLHAKSSRKFLLATVMTDYSLHEIWLYDEVDAYFVATDEMRRELSEQCRTGQKIFATGIPIGEEFCAVKRQSEKLSTTILIMGGGLGLGSIEDTLIELNKIARPLKIIIVAGQNETLISRLKRLREKIYHEVEILGYTSDICGLMSTADLLITKPGGLTMTEAFATGLPLILHAPIPGPEALNATFAISHGAAVSVGEEKISTVVTELLNDSARLEKMKHCAEKLSKPSAAREIVNHIKSHEKFN